MTISRRRRESCPARRRQLYTKCDLCSAVRNHLIWLYVTVCGLWLCVAVQPQAGDGHCGVGALRADHPNLGSELHGMRVFLLLKGRATSQPIRHVRAHSGYSEDSTPVLTVLANAMNRPLPSPEDEMSD